MTRSQISNFNQIFEKIHQFGDRHAVISYCDDDRPWSGAELHTAIIELAAGIRSKGWKGRQIALFSPNRTSWIITALSIIASGNTVVPLDIQMEEDVLIHCLDKSEATAAFCSREGQERLSRLSDVELDEIYLTDEPDSPLFWETLRQDPGEEIPAIDPERPLVLFFTSGTTGKPKGVPLREKNILPQIAALDEMDLVHQDDRLLAPLPFHHVYPFVIGMLTPLSFGVPVIIPESLTGPSILGALKQSQGTILLGVPRLYRLIIENINEKAGDSRLFRWLLKISSGIQKSTGVKAGRFLLAPLHKKFGQRLRLLASGGSALVPELARTLVALGWDVGTGYGLSETSPLLSFNSPDEFQPESAGKPIKGVDIKIDPDALPNQTHRDDQANQRGEVLARGDNVFDGYWNLPEETEKAFTEDGWFRTGDLGYIGKNGHLYLEGRVSTMIVTESGKNIHPQDLESFYAENPAIEEIGISYENGRLVGLVYPSVEGDPEEVRRKIQRTVQDLGSSLPSYKRIGELLITNRELPKTRLGKIQRHRLKERIEQSRSQSESSTDRSPVTREEMKPEDQELLDNPAADTIWSWLSERYSSKQLQPDSDLELDLGIDSMEWVNITLEIKQQTGIQLDEETLAELETVRDLLKEVASRKAGKQEGELAASGPPLEDPESVLTDRQKRWLKKPGPVNRSILRGLYQLNRLLMNSCFKLTVEGRENLPGQGPFLLAPNHTSHLDPFVLGAALPFSDHLNTYWAAWTGVAFKNPLVRLFSRMAGAIPIDPDRGKFSSLALGAAVLKQENNLIWFPEGQRSPSGELLPFEPGIGVLLDHYRVPVIPVYIDGTYEALPRGAFFPKFRAVSLRFGQPVNPKQLEQEGEGEKAYQKITQGLEKRVEALSGEL